MQPQDVREDIRFENDGEKGSRLLLHEETVQEVQEEEEQAAES